MTEPINHRIEDDQILAHRRSYLLGGYEIDYCHKHHKVKEAHHISNDRTPPRTGNNQFQGWPAQDTFRPASVQEPAQFGSSFSLVGSSPAQETSQIGSPLKDPLIENPFSPFENSFQTPLFQDPPRISPGPQFFQDPGVTLFQDPTPSNNEIRSSTGKCLVPGQPVIFFPSLDSRAASCEARDCDTTGFLEHHLGDDAVEGSVGCIDPDDETTEPNSFLRCFSGLCSSTRTVDSVTFGVQRLEGRDATIEVKLYKGGSDGCANSASVAALFRQAPTAIALASVTQGVNFQATVLIRPTITLSPTESLLVEIKAPSLKNVGKFFVADSLDISPPQCGPSYLQSDVCAADAANPTDVATFGADFAGTSFVIRVNTKVPLVLQPITPAPILQPVPAPVAQPVITPELQPIPTLQENCFASFFSALSCVNDYLFGWLLPF